MTTTKHRTKTDLFFITLIFIPAGFVSFLALLAYIKAPLSYQYPPEWAVAICALIFWVNALSAWKGTYYFIKNDYLHIRFAFIMRKKILLTDIVEMRKKELGLFIYGLSKDVLGIKTRKGELINITPVNRDDFIALIEMERRATIDRMKITS